MGTRQTTFGKLERERAKKAKAAAKRARRQDRSEGDPEGFDDDDVSGTPAVRVSSDTSADLLKRIEELHARYDAEEINFLAFEAEKTELMERLAALPLDDA
ncbi:MAG TPA: hypothetical protein VI916_00405 [Acidimicrobiia bacterium]|nr:hypothetical protein [Acidimicrobiia bacterium]